MKVSAAATVAAVERLLRLLEVHPWVKPVRAADQVCLVTLRACAKRSAASYAATMMAPLAAMAEATELRGYPAPGQLDRLGMAVTVPTDARTDTATMKRSHKLLRQLPMTFR